MQGTRSIKYGSISGGDGASGTIFSAAATYGELKNENQSIGALATGMSALIKLPSGGNPVKVTSDSQSLPEGDFTLYFVMDKNNSGYGRN